MDALTTENPLQMVRKTAAQVQSDLWPEPSPFPVGLPPVERFDYEMIPGVLREWVRDISERLQCPPDFVGVTAVVTLASVIGRQLAVRPQARGDWEVIPNLWGALIGRPSTMKTPAATEPLNQVQKLENAAAAEFARKMNAAEAALAAAKVVLAAKKSSARKQAKNGEEIDGKELVMRAADHDEPKRERFKTNDSTVEKLGEIMSENPRGILLHRDELIGWLLSLDREGSETARAFALESWNGNKAFTFDRIGRGTIDIEACCLSVIGGIQPDRLAQYFSETLKSSGGGDGLLQRFALAVWPDDKSDWKHVDRYPNTVAKNNAAALYERVARLDTYGAQQESYPDGNPDGLPYLRFDTQAQKLWDDWYTELQVSARAEESVLMEGWQLKAPKFVASIALILHLCESVASKPISGDSLARSLAWHWYLQSHAKRIYSRVMSPEIAAAVALDEKIRKGKLPPMFSPRDVYLKGWAGLDRIGADKAIALLVELDRARVTTVETGGRPSQRVEINPKIFNGAGA